MKTKLKDNKIFRAIIIPICIAMCFLGQFIPAVNGFSSAAWGVLFIFIGSLILWLTIGIDWPSLLCIFALGFIQADGMGFANIFKASFGNDVFLFLLFTFICTYALSKTSLIRRVAISFVSSKAAKKNGYAFIFLFLFSVLLLGLFMSPSVLFVVILPILDEILEVAKIEKTDKIAKVMMIGLGFTVSISSGMTTIAHVFPLMAMTAAHIEVSILSYMAFGIPTGLVLFLLMYFLLILFIRPDVKKLKDSNVEQLKGTLPKINKQDITVLSIFTLVLLTWIVLDIVKSVLPDFRSAMKPFGTAFPAMFGVILLCIIRIDNKPLLTVGDAFKNGVPWGSLIMCAGTLALGFALTNDGVGIKTFLSTNLEPLLKGLPGIVLLIIFGIWAAIQTNLSSNMVTATLVATVAGTIIAATNTGLNLEATICIIGMLASFAFATPPSMPHIAIVAGSESCTTKDVLLYGSILMVLSVAAALLIAYPIGSLIF